MIRPKAFTCTTCRGTKPNTKLSQTFHIEMIATDVVDKSVHRLVLTKEVGAKYLRRDMDAQYMADELTECNWNNVSISYYPTNRQIHSIIDANNPTVAPNNAIVEEVDAKGRNGRRKLK